MCVAPLCALWSHLPPWVLAVVLCEGEDMSLPLQRRRWAQEAPGCGAGRWQVCIHSQDSKVVSLRSRTEASNQQTQPVSLSLLTPVTLGHFGKESLCSSVPRTLSPGFSRICPSPTAASLCFHSPNTFIRLGNFALPRILAGRWKATSLFPFSICITGGPGNYMALPLISGLDWLNEMEFGGWYVCLFDLLRYPFLNISILLTLFCWWW